eukprot:m.11446 g.11446  ORF g.11446 m.11446 type:complete len:87 (+) comp7381_c0_seq1:929-1189(+)
MSGLNSAQRTSNPLARFDCMAAGVIGASGGLATAVDASASATTVARHRGAKVARPMPSDAICTILRVLPLTPANQLILRIRIKIFR